MTSAACGPPAIGGCARSHEAAASTWMAQPAGWAVVQMNPRARGLMIMAGASSAARRRARSTVGAAKGWRSWRGADARRLPQHRLLLEAAAVSRDDRLYRRARGGRIGVHQQQHLRSLVIDHAIGPSPLPLG